MVRGEIHSHRSDLEVAGLTCTGCHPLSRRGVVDGVVRGGVVNSVSCSTEVCESSEGHVRAGSHEGDESNQGKGLE